MRIPKERTLKSARSRAWGAFSKFIRLRDCLKTTKRPDYCICITCGKWTPNSRGQLQAGHFIPGRGNAVLFDETGVNGQCKTCNISKGGLPLIYRKVMVDRYGAALVEELELKYYKTRKLSIAEYDLIRLHYETEYNKYATTGGVNG